MREFVINLGVFLVSVGAVKIIIGIFKNRKER